jgi:hypothetical protein
MAGIQSLLGGGAKSFGIDKLSENLSPQMRELLPFAINPQGYLVGKAVNSLADYLGYGNEVKDLQEDAKANKDYAKEIIRDTVGDLLPQPIGDFVRSTPNTPYEPVGSYWDPEQNAFVNPNENNLDPTGQRVNSSDELREALYGTITPNYARFVGPQELNSPSDQIGMKFLAEDLGVPPTQQETGVNILDVLNAMNADGTINTDSQSFTGPQVERSQLSENNAYDLGNSLSDYLSTTGNDGKLENLLQDQTSYKYGGQIYGGRR